MKKMTYCFPFITESNSNLDTKITYSVVRFSENYMKLTVSVITLVVICAKGNIILSSPSIRNDYTSVADLVCILCTEDRSSSRRAKIWHWKLEQCKVPCWKMITASKCSKFKVLGSFDKVVVKRTLGTIVVYVWTMYIKVPKTNNKYVLDLST